MPDPIRAPRGGEPGLGEDARAVRGGIHRIEHDQAAVFDPAIRIGEGLRDRRGEARAQPAAVQTQLLGGWQPLSAADVVVQKQARTQQPGGAARRTQRQDKAQRPDDVRGDGQEALTFLQGLADQAELVGFQVAQPTMDQLGAGRGGVGREVMLLHKGHGKAPAGRIPRDAGPVNTPADNEKVDRHR